MITDIQGKGSILTDPAIHSKELFKTDSTNHNDYGFASFFGG